MSIDEALRDIPRQALDLDFARDEVDEAALGLDARRLAVMDDGDRDPHRLVHGDPDEVGVEELVRDGVDLQVLDHGVVHIGVDGDLEDRVLPRLESQDLDDVLLAHDERSALHRFPVQDRRYEALLPQAARGIGPQSLPFLALDDDVHGVLLKRRESSPSSPR